MVELLAKKAELTVLNAVNGMAMPMSHNINIASVAIRSLAPMLKPATQGPTSLRNVPGSLWRRCMVGGVVLLLLRAGVVAPRASMRVVCFGAGVDTWAEGIGLCTMDRAGCCGAVGAAFGG